MILFKDSKKFSEYQYDIEDDFERDVVKRRKLGTVQYFVTFLSIALVKIGVFILRRELV